MPKPRGVMDLKSLIEFASVQAEKIFRKTGVIYPMYHGITPDGQHKVMMPPGLGDKDLDVALMKVQFTLENIDTLVFIDEAWILDDRRGQIGIDIEKIRREGVRNHPDRREVVMFAAENKRGEMQTASRFILRPEIGRPTLSPLKIDDMRDVESSGRMVGLLNWEKQR